MRHMFVDTAAWVAVADRSDTAGSAVREARDEWLSAGGMLTTTDYVIDETLTTVRFRLGLDAAEAWWLQIDGSARLRIESIDEPRRDRARALFFRYRDTGLLLYRLLQFRRDARIAHSSGIDAGLPFPANAL